MKRTLLNKTVAGFATLFFSHSLLAASAAEQFGTHKWPVLYKLITNKEPSLCNSALESTKTLFDSSSVVFNAEENFLTKNPPLNWVPLQPDDEKSSNLSTLTLDLDGNGSKQVVLYRNLPFNWKGNWHYSYVFKNQSSFDNHKKEILANWNKISEDQNQYSTQNNLEGIGYFPSYKSADKEIFTGNVWAEHNLFKFNNRYYFFQAENNFDILSPANIVINRLFADGHIENTCEISVDKAIAQHTRFINTNSVSSFIKIIRTIGDGGPDIGTAHYGLMHNTQAIAAEQRAAYRPWTLDQARSPYYIFDERMIAYLENWSLENAWNRREYQALQEHMNAAEAGEIEFLKNEFGLPDEAAKKNGKKIIQQLLAARILIPSGYELNSQSTDLYFPSNKLSSIFLLRNKNAVDAIPKEKKNELIQFSLEWPYGLAKLLALGANPNTSDDIQKTPLMLAAHLNRPDAIKLLLKAGADVNAKTKLDAGFSQQAITNNRTALMYAAENANPIAMKILVEAGADIAAKDSKGNGIASYLAKNPRLSDADKKLDIIEITKQAERFGSPSFDCKKANSAIEKAICADEVLAMFDNELGVAFTRAKNRFGDTLVKEQQAWLVRRNSTCKDAPTLQDCLAEITRTRIRYLHNRLAE